MLAAICFLFALPYARTLLYPLEYRELIEKYSSENGLQPEFIAGVIYTESRFRPEAVSYADAKGLMQITEDTFEWAAWRMGDTTTTYEQIFEPEVNIKYGSYILKLLKEEFVSLEVTLAAYNAGWGNVKEWLADENYSPNGTELVEIPFKDTKNYIPDVLNASEIYKELYFS